MVYGLVLLGISSACCVVLYRSGLIVKSVAKRTLYFKRNGSTKHGILVLGGEIERELYLIEYLNGNHSVDYTCVCISSGWFNEGSEELKSIQRKRSIVFDRKAIDTVSNATCLVDWFQKNEITHLTVITSEGHHLRAYVVCKVVFGMRGIVCELVDVPNARFTQRGTISMPKESIWKVVRDAMRSIMWILFGIDGRSISALFHPNRITFSS
uniref:DUF218 domain-containing protein n=1 Tax=Timspurckia oligopyrenoides TaxID=708627 RepID=A0A7S0ZBL6_9RHOD|mmetsp:Transcript_11469/g.20745  ORF Transcript_11469/g.20745 Transcript_11469/m.20745 type:complete len:211 (+) Transcript_11469:378-1010(+)